MTPEEKLKNDNKVTEYNKRTRKWKYVDTGDTWKVLLYEDEEIVDLQPGKSFAILKKKKVNKTQPGAEHWTYSRKKKGAPDYLTELRKKDPEAYKLRMEEHGKKLKRYHAKKKALEDISGLVKDILSDPDIAKSMVKDKKLPEWTDYIEDPNGVALMIGQIMMKAMKGDVHSAEFLSKMAGWVKPNGEVIINTTGDANLFSSPTINFEVVNPSETQTKILEENDSTPADVIEAEVVEPEETIESDIPEVVEISEKVEEQKIKEPTDSVEVEILEESQEKPVEQEKPQEVENEKPEVPKIPKVEPLYEITDSDWEVVDAK